MMSKDEVVQPSEITGGKHQKRKRVSEKRVYSTPWIRFVARMFDYALIFLAVFILREVFHLQLFFEFPIPFELVLWIPIEALFLILFRRTPGKWLLKCTVISERGLKLHYKEALSRSFSVWVRGMGVGLFFLSIFTMLYAYIALTKNGKTSWDRDEKTTVQHHPIHPIRLFFALLFIICVIVLLYRV